MKGLTVSSSNTITILAMEETSTVTARGSGGGSMSSGGDVMTGRAASSEKRHYVCGW